MTTIPQSVIRQASELNEAVVITDGRGHTVWANDAFTRLCGYTREELQNRKPGELVQGPDTDDRAVQAIGRNLHKGEAVSEVLLNYHKEGYSYWTLLTIQPIRDHRGGLRLFASVQQEIDPAEAGGRQRFRRVPALHHRLKQLVDELSFGFEGEKKTVDPFSKPTAAGKSPARRS